MKLTTLQTARKKARSLFILSTLLLLLSTNVHAQDTLFFEDFNREVGSTGCPISIDFEGGFGLSYPIPHEDYYNRFSCSDTALAVSYNNDWGGGEIFMKIVFDSTKMKVGNIFNLSFNVISLSSNGGTFFNNSEYSLSSSIGSGRTFGFSEYDNRIIKKERIISKLEINKNTFIWTPDKIEILFSIGSGFILDNLLLSIEIITDIEKEELINEEKIKLYYNLQGVITHEPKDGEFVVAILENGERKKLIFHSVPSE